MNKTKTKERYYAVRVSKGPFCPNDLFQDVLDKIKKQHKYPYASFITNFENYFEIGNYSDGSDLMSPELLLNCVKRDVDDTTNHRHLFDLLNYEVVWYNGKLIKNKEEIKMAFKYNKDFIENMAKEFMDLVCEHYCADAMSVYFNGERYSSVAHRKNDEDFYEFIKQDATFHPMEITEYTVRNNILAFSTEGYLYDILYGGYPKWFEDFCEKYNVYVEPATSWFYHFCPNSEWDEWETDDYEIEEETYLYRGSCELNNLPLIKAVADFWFILSRDYGDKGSCVLGAGFTFKYEGKKYRLAACSPYQGSLSWEHDKDLIHECLELIGCTDIHYNWGNMD